MSVCLLVCRSNHPQCLSNLQTRVCLILCLFVCLSLYFPVCFSACTFNHMQCIWKCRQCLKTIHNACQTGKQQSVRLVLSACLSPCLCVCLHTLDFLTQVVNVKQSACLYVCLSLCLSACFWIPSTCSACQTVPSTWQTIYNACQISKNQSVCVSVYLCVCLSACLPLLAYQAHAVHLKL